MLNKIATFCAGIHVTSAVYFFFCNNWAAGFANISAALWAFHTTQE